MSLKEQLKSAAIKSVPWRKIFFLVVLITALDQASKWWILSEFRLGEVREVIPELFNLVLVFNRGVAFGVLNNLEDPFRLIVLHGFTLLALTAVFYFIVIEFRDQLRPQLYLSLVLGGAVGNIIDRLYHGAVVDFLDFYWGSYHWPAFNIADSAISLGVCLLFVEQLFFAPKAAPSEPAENKA